MLGKELQRVLFVFKFLSSLEHYFTEYSEYASFVFLLLKDSSVLISRFLPESTGTKHKKDIIVDDRKEIFRTRYRRRLPPRVSNQLTCLND